VNPLVPGRGVLGCEYAGDLLEKIERTNCRKGCIHADPIDDYVNCRLGLLAAVFVNEGQAMPEFDLHGNRYVTCLRRQLPEPEPPVDLGPDLFEATS
jgi:hypothetical protein